MLIKISDNTYQFHKPMFLNGIDLTTSFSIRKRSDGAWYSNYFDLEGDTPTEVVEAYNEMISSGNYY